jgi:DNA-binding transcriptional ArsR family regulator
MPKTKKNLKPLPDDALLEATECLKTIAHPHRLRVIELLLAGDHTVGELAEACGIASHAMSEHLRLLKDRGLLTAERDGRKVYYRIAEPALEGIIDCIRSHHGAAHSTD